MTIDDRVKMVIGTQAVQIIALSAQLEEAKAKIQVLESRILELVGDQKIENGSGMDPIQFEMPAK